MKYFGRSDIYPMDTYSLEEFVDNWQSSVTSVIPLPCSLDSFLV